MWNYTGTPQWDLISNSVITNTGGTLAFFSLEITGTITDYCSGGEAKVRFNHAVSGNINHDFSIDYLAIKDDHGIGSGITDHGAMSGLRDNDHRHYLLRLFTHHTIVSGEDLVINDYEQKIVHHNFTVNGSGTVTINGSGDLVAIGV